jgi:hypothetical protein
VIDALWPGYINGDLVNGYDLYAEIEYTGEYMQGIDFDGNAVGGTYAGASASSQASVTSNVKIVAYEAEWVPENESVDSSAVENVEEKEEDEETSDSVSYGADAVFVARKAGKVANPSKKEEAAPIYEATIAGIEPSTSGSSRVCFALALSAILLLLY